MNRFVLLAGIAPLLPCMLTPTHAFAADLSFTGNLRAVSTGAITLRLSDGIVIDARLPQANELSAPTIAAKYKFADQVQISCKRIKVVWDPSVRCFHLLELTRIDFVREASRNESAQVRASLSWNEGENLLKPIPEGPQLAKPVDPEGLEHVREVNLARAAKMPGFIADEEAIRSFRASGGAK